MKKILLFFITLTSVFFVHAQEVKMTYWNSSLSQQVPKKDAGFSKSVSTFSNGIVITQIIDLKTDDIVDREVFKNDEPCDIWIKKVENEIQTIDYNFDLEYSEADCAPDDFPDKLRLFMFDDIEKGYIAPCIATGDNDVFRYLHKRIFAHYKSLCNNKDLTPAKVVTRFTITTDGNVSNIAILKGANPLYDKEALRLIRELKFSNPAQIKGKPTELCITCPILFDNRLFCPQPKKK